MLKKLDILSDHPWLRQFTPRDINPSWLPSILISHSTFFLPSFHPFRKTTTSQSHPKSKLSISPFNSSPLSSDISLHIISKFQVTRNGSNKNRVRLSYIPWPPTLPSLTKTKTVSPTFGPVCSTWTGSSLIRRTSIPSAITSSFTSTESHLCRGASKPNSKAVPDQKYSSRPPSLPKLS